MKSLILILLVAIFLSQLVSAYKWEQRISLNMVDVLNTFTSWLPTKDNTGGFGEVDLTKYSNVSEVYFETLANFIFTGIPNDVGGCSVRLYDAINNVGINESEYTIAVGGVSYKRSKNLTHIFNQTRPIIVMTQTKASDVNSICALHHANLVIVQDGKISKTRTMISLGGSLQEGDACGDPEEIIVEPKYWNFSANDFVKTNITFAGTQRATGATSLSRMILSNTTTNIATLTTVGGIIVFNYTNSSNINTNISNGGLLKVGLCRLFGIDSGLMRNAFLVVDQDGIDITNPKTVTMFQTEVDYRVTNSLTPNKENNQSEYFNSTNWDVINLNPYATYVISNTNSSATAYADMLKGIRIPESNITMLNTTLTYVKSQQMNELYFLRNDYLQTEIWANTSGVTGISDSKLIFYINGLRCWYYDKVNDKLVLNSGCRLPLPSGMVSYF